MMFRFLMAKVLDLIKFFDILEENKKREKEKATDAFPRERSAKSSHTVAKGPYGKESRQGHTGDA